MVRTHQSNPIRRVRRGLVAVMGLTAALLFLSGQSTRTTRATATDSRFGLHTGRLSFSAASPYFHELGDQLYVRFGPPNDEYGWKEVRTTDGIAQCQSCCNPGHSACSCLLGSFYYCSPPSRTPLPALPSATNLLAGVVVGRYDDIEPTSGTDLIGAYPTGHEAEYQSYINTLVQAYGSGVKYWEVGNENDLADFWVGTPSEYASLVTLTSTSIKNVCADCRVGVSVSSPDQTSEWLAAIGSVCSSFDFIDAHYLQLDFIPSGDLTALAQACPGKEIITTETGILDYIYNPDKTQAGGSYDLQAQDLSKFNTLLFGEGYSKIFMYLIDTDYGAGPIFLHNALLDEDETAKPAYTAYGTMVNKIDTFTSVAKITDGQYKYIFSTKDPVYVLWCDSAPCALPGELTGTLSVTDYLGNVTQVLSTDLTLTSVPVYVELIGPLPDTTPPAPITDLQTS